MELRNSSLFAIFLSLFLFDSCLYSQENHEPDVIVATINGENITLKELLANPKSQTRIGKIGKKILLPKDELLVLWPFLRESLEEMIDYKLILQETKAVNLNVSKEEIAEEVRDILPGLEVDVQGEIENMFKYLDNKAFIIVAARKLSDFYKLYTSPLQEELDRYYEDHKQEFVSPPLLKLRYSLLKYSEYGGYKEALDAAKKLRTPEQRNRFITNSNLMISDNSEKEPGWVDLSSVNDMEEDLKKAVLSLKLDEITEPVELLEGYIIVQLIDRKEGGLQPLSNVENEIRKKLERQRQADGRKKLIKMLREKAKIQIITPYSEDRKSH